MAANDMGSPTNRDQVDVAELGLAFVVVVSFLGTIWWYLIT